jgi:serine/threonine-protein kinase
VAPDEEPGSPLAQAIAEAAVAAAPRTLPEELTVPPDPDEAPPLDLATLSGPVEATLTPPAEDEEPELVFELLAEPLLGVTEDTGADAGPEPLPDLPPVTTDPVAPPPRSAAPRTETPAPQRRPELEPEPAPLPAPPSLARPPELTPLAFASSESGTQAGAEPDPLPELPVAPGLRIIDEAPEEGGEVTRVRLLPLSSGAALARATTGVLESASAEIDRLAPLPEEPQPDVESETRRRPAADVARFPTEMAIGALPEEEEALPEEAAPPRSATPPARSTRPRTPAAPTAAAAEDPQTNVWSFTSDPLAGRKSEVLGKPIIADRYLILEDLGQGGMARIHKVRHLNLGKEFALKIIHAEMSGDAQMRKSFFREARVASQMDHPNIVQVTDFGADPVLGAYIVMEYLKGETLHDRMGREKRLRVSVALEVILQVAEALHYMHQQDIIHCDIKPENIFLCSLPSEQRRRVQVKLIDFGLSRRGAMGAQLARTEVGGTPHYMAPEQIRGLAPQPSMDIYALGVLLYEMLTGDPPFDGTVTELINAHLLEAPPPPSSRIAEPLDERVEALILKALEKDPADRQPSMGQVVYELRTLMDMLGIRQARRRAPVERATPPTGADALLDQPRLVFEHCPCPLFRVDTEPRVLAANPALCHFLGLSLDQLVGRPLAETRLGLFYPGLRDEVLAAAEQSAPLQRLITFQKDATRAVSVMLWMVPEVDTLTGVITFTGVIVPLNVDPPAG